MCRYTHTHIYIYIYLFVDVYIYIYICTHTHTRVYERQPASEAAPVSMKPQGDTSYLQRHWQVPKNESEDKATRSKRAISCLGYACAPKSSTWLPGKSSRHGITVLYLCKFWAYTRKACDSNVHPHPSLTNCAETTASGHTPASPPREESTYPRSQGSLGNHWKSIALHP